MNLLYFVWDADPVIFSIGEHGIRWYGLLLAIGFLLGYIVLGRIMKKEGYEQKQSDKFAIYIILGCVIGLRLGHCLFYNPGYYLSHPLEILKVWEGGLASHGGAIGILLAIWLYARCTKMPYFESLDKVAVVVPLAGAFVRIGNFINSEILGVPTTLPWGVKFMRNMEDLNEAYIASNGACPDLGSECLSEFMIARHPTQLYEAFFYIAMFFVFFLIYSKFAKNWKHGTFLGWFVFVLFTFRFLIEYTKTEQAEFIWNAPITMGQLLSIPFIIFGIVLVVRQYWKKGKAKPIANGEKIRNTKK
ncbi:MAG: prolipoprotein diacylglyceryl transferase [Bacteroidales bacterium]|nr:prolipoprotein diacylglyceryl transferase [Bacteroidales bacterium]